MNMLAFVLWLLGWPALFAFTDHNHGVDIPAEAILAVLCVWVIVAALIYNYKQES